MKLASKINCTACGACVNICSQSALSLVVNRDGFFEVKIDPFKCVDCGLCSKVCPVLKGTSETETGTNYFACWNSDDNVRKNSASGGAFSAIAVEIIRQGGVVYGAAIEGFDIVHKRVETMEELMPLFGSKYQPGDLTGIYRQVKADLLNKRCVLFSGMSCQVAGLKSYLLNINTDKLYTIDTICGGFSTMLPMLLLKNSGKYKGIKCFRNKDNGWQPVGFRYDLQMIKLSGEVEDFKLDNLVLNTFSSKLLKRASCCNCRFTTPHRMSDATIGDFWGDKRFRAQHNNGLSVIAIHNSRINELINDSQLKIEPISSAEMIQSNHNYYWTRFPLIPYFLSRKLAIWGLKHNHQQLSAHLMRPKSLAGIVMSLYLKINKIYRNKYSLKIFRK